MIGIKTGDDDGLGMQRRHFLAEGIGLIHARKFLHLRLAGVIGVHHANYFGGLASRLLCRRQN